MITSGCICLTKSSTQRAAQKRATTGAFCWCSLCWSSIVRVFSVALLESEELHQTGQTNVQRKLKAAVAWCERINALEPDLRDGKTWYYALLGESIFYEWQSKNETLVALLDYARIRPQLAQSAQSRLL
jgi:hypothetical protein